jgi:arylsulfatase A-like enzyme
MNFRRNSILFAIIAAILLLETTVATVDAGVPAARPNILLIMTDDQGWSDLGIHGNPVLETPNLDRLAGEGVEFTQFYVSPVCSLTRASLLTGRHPLRTGCVDTRMGRDTLGRNEITVGQLLLQAGYATALFGKWHQGRYMPDHPNHRGFGEYFGFWQYGHVERYFHPDRLWRNKERVECRGHITDLLTDAAIDFISRPRDEPFFCYLAYNVPHAPFQAPDDYLKHYLHRGVPSREAQIYALLAHCDANIGRLLEVLDKQGLRDNTAVLFLSDNGGIHKHFTAGLRGSKGTMYEGGLLSPLLVRYPGHFPSSVKVSAMSDVIDLTPTLCELAGAKLPIDRQIDGHSLLPLLKKGRGEGTHEYLYHHWRTDRNGRVEDRFMVRDRQFKLLGDQLYDLTTDRGEQHDLSKQKPEIVARLRDHYSKWFDDVSAGQAFARALIEVGREDENPVELQASWADLHGKNTLYYFDAYDWDTIDGWNQPGDSAAWNLRVVRRGRYRVTISYGCAHHDAGGKFRIAAGEDEITGQAEATPSASVFVTRNIGELELRKGNTSLRVSATEIPGKQLMSLNRIWLERLE